MVYMTKRQQVPVPVYFIAAGYFDGGYLNIVSAFFTTYTLFSARKLYCVITDRFKTEQF